MAVQAQMCQNENRVLGDDNGYNDMLFALQQKQQEFQILQNQNQTLFDTNNGVYGLDIDQFVKFQSERLRLALREQSNRQLAVAMRKMESTAQMALARKDQEIARAANRTVELERLVVKLEMESKAWQRVARENETMAAYLNNTLERLKEQGLCSVSAADGESCCGDADDRR